MVAPTPAADDVGFIASKTFDVVVLPKTTGAAILKGEVISQNEAAAGAYRTAPAAATTGNFAVAVKPAATADTQVEAVSSGFVTVRCTGAIDPDRYVMVSGTVAGRVMAAASATVAPLAVVGKYVGKAGANTRNGMPIPAAADGDVVIIDLNRRTS